MAKFGDVTQYFDPGLTLTVKGRDYRVPLPSAELGLWCRTMTAVSDLDSDSTEEQLQAAAEQVAKLPPLPGPKTMPEHLLGDVHARMVADGVEDPYIEFCAMTVFFWIMGGESAAHRYWTSGGHPEARGPDNRASRRAKSTRKTATAAASGTPTPASTSGTSSRPRSGRNGRRGGSRGRRS
ncbi:hypothetical protein CSH63_24810 [Micromonospora tulbaghiae]|uniref:DUF7426 domain-containing protein n=1 Tax=Micromonospora tulbaghiae TaxID=479978 RepID=A0A386WQ91_9ACTN|nr:hypothetical protein [Micromonospora tulbaghiae]AYF30606.1 hypothetical protein CSH63_24810 [Micromonospora tulbaghiae]